MNKVEFKVEVDRHYETCGQIADVLSITPASLSKKLNGKSEFTQKEIMAFKTHYDLSNDRLAEIFFAQ